MNDFDIGRLNYLLGENKSYLIYKSILANKIDYKKLINLLPILDVDDLSIILRYDKDYKISFLLKIANKAYEDDILRQAVYLYKRHGINHIISLFKYIDIEDFKEAIKKSV